MLQSNCLIAFVLSLIYLVENIYLARTSLSYSWHHPVQPVRYVRYSNTGHTIRRLPASIVRHQIGNHVTSYQLPPTIPMHSNTRWANHPNHVPVVHHQPSFLAPNRPSIAASNQPIQPTRIAPLPNNNIESAPVFASPVSTFNSSSRPSNSRPIVSTNTVSRPISRRPSIMVPSPSPSSTKPPTRSRTTSSAPGYAVTPGPTPPSVTVNDADIGFEVTSSSDSASLGGLASPRTPARTIPARIPSELNGANDRDNDESPSSVDPNGF